MKLFLVIVNLVACVIWALIVGMKIEQEKQCWLEVIIVLLFGAATVLYAMEGPE